MFIYSRTARLSLVTSSGTLTNYSRLQVHKYSPRHMLPRSSLAEESVEGVVSSAQGLVRRHLAIRLDAVLQAVQLPAGIADLDSGLADVD